MNLLKSTYKLSKKYLSTSTTEIKLSWLSVLVLVRLPGKNLVLEQAYIFVGNIPEHYYAYYLNLPINSSIHIHVGDTNFDLKYFLENPLYYRHYVSNPRNKIWKIISHQLSVEKVKIINLIEKYGPFSKICISERTKKILHPLFTRFEIYGRNMDHVMLSP